MKRGSHTPWGPAQHSEYIAEGIIRVDTASHGGLHLSPQRHEELQAMFRSFPTWAGGRWYEEDCDACAVIVAFPDVFPDSQDSAREMVAWSVARNLAAGGQSGKWQRVADYMDKVTV